MEMDLEVDLGQEGLNMIFFDYEVLMLRHAWNVAIGSVHLSTAELWKHVCRVLKESGGRRKSISRASVINSANRFHKNGIWEYYEATGKGGYRKLFQPIMTEEELLETIKTIIVDRLNLELEKIRGHS